MVIPSPSGRFALETETESEEQDGRTWRYVRLAVREAGGGVATPLGGEPYPAWFSLRAGWDEQERLWIRSGDTGTSVYERAGSAWERRIWAADATGGEPRWVHDVGTGRDVAVVGGSPPEGMIEVRDG